MEILRVEVFHSEAFKSSLATTGSLNAGTKNAIRRFYGTNPPRLPKVIDTRSGDKAVNHATYQTSEMDMGPEHVANGGNGALGPALGNHLDNDGYGYNDNIQDDDKGTSTGHQVCASAVTSVESGQSSAESPVTDPLQQGDVTNSPKSVIGNTESTAGSPKASNCYGDGGSIVGITRAQGNTQVSQEKNSVGKPAVTTESVVYLDSQVGGFAQTALERLENINSDTDLFELLCSLDLWVLAYSKMKSKPGNMIMGHHKETFDGISIDKIMKMISDIRSQKFQFKPVRRIHIPKKNGKMRPLGIPSPMDKLVQQVIRMIFERLYEPEFKSTSHGFRPGKGCHTALKQVSTWNGVTWVIEGDIKAYFDTVDHQILAELIGKKVRNQRFMDLYWKLVKAGYVETGVSDKKQPSNIDVPQGGVLSPLLSNIYLHEFDLFIENIIGEYSSEGKLIYKVNPIIAKYSDKLTKLYKEYQETRNPDTLKEIRRLRVERNSIPSRIRTGNRVRYVRYADYWIIGIIGDVQLAKKIKQLAASFISDKLKLVLSEEKTKITNIYENKASFLGALIFVNKPGLGNSKIATRHMKDGRKIISRVNHIRIWFNAPTAEIVVKLKEKGFLKPTGETNAITKWIFLDHPTIILRYNAVSRGLWNYYSFVDNLSQIRSLIHYILLHSCAKTLARKYNLRSRAQAFKKFGKLLSITNEKGKEYSFFFPESGAKTNNFQINNSPPFPGLEVMNWSVETQNVYFSSCVICGETEKIQMLHIKHLKKEGDKATGFLAAMSKLNRKQIPVCQPCHVKIHKGHYDVSALNKLKAYLKF